MNIAIIGGNSQVGTELCFLLRNQGHQIFPVIRSRIGAAFLRHHGFECRIADVNNPVDAKKVLQDVDWVVLSVYVSDVGGPSQKSRSSGDVLIRNAVTCSNDSAGIIYFSSIRAFSRRVDAAAPLWGMPYDNEKRHGEQVLFDSARSTGKACYALRLGHVFGKNQSKTRTIMDMIHGDGDSLTLQVNSDRQSNIVHTVTIADAILACQTRQFSPGIYSLVNSPQWTWREVFDYYSASEPKKIVYAGPKRGTVPAQTIRKAFSTIIPILLRRGYSVLGAARVLALPSNIDQYAQYRFIAQKIRSELRQYKKDETSAKFISEFRYQPIPGPLVPGLTDTESLLNTSDIPDGIF